MAADFANYLIQQWCIGLYDLYIKGAGGKNKFFYCPGESIVDLVGSPSTCYSLAVADCALGDALIIEMDVPDNSFWSFQLGCVWSKPLENLFNQTEINMERAVIDSDGKFRAVICHDDPGYANWMEVIDRTEFIIVLRNYKEVTKVLIDPPTLKTVKLSELSDHLPKDTVMITAEQRQNNLEHRRTGIKNLYDMVNRDDK